MKIEDQLRRYRLPEPPPALETRILANLDSGEEAAPSWMRSPAWAALFTLVVLIFAARLSTEQPGEASAADIPSSLALREAELANILALDGAKRKEPPKVEWRPEAMLRPRRLPEIPTYAS